MANKGAAAVKNVPCALCLLASTLPEKVVNMSQKYVLGPRPRPLLMGESKYDNQEWQGSMQWGRYKCRDVEGHIDRETARDIERERENIDIERQI